MGRIERSGNVFARRDAPRHRAQIRRMWIAPRLKGHPRPAGRWRQGVPWKRGFARFWWAPAEPGPPFRGCSPSGAGHADGQGHGPKRGVCAMTLVGQITQALRRQMTQNESWSWPKMRKRVPQCKRQKTTSRPKVIAIQMATETQCSSKVTFDEHFNQRPLPLKAGTSALTAMSTGQWLYSIEMPTPSFFR